MLWPVGRQARSDGRKKSRGSETPEQKRARTEVLVGWTVLLLVGVLCMAWLAGFVGLRTGTVETGRGRALIGACERGADGAHCAARLTSWTDAPGRTGHHTGHRTGDPVVVESNSVTRGEIEVVGRIQHRTRIINTGVAKGRSEQYSTEVIVNASDYVMPQWLRLLYVAGFGLVWAALAWWLGKLWFKHRSRA